MSDQSRSEVGRVFEKYEEWFIRYLWFSGGFAAGAILNATYQQGGVPI